VSEIQVPLKSDKTNGYFMCRPVDIYGNISLNCSVTFLLQRCRESRNMHFMFRNFSFKIYAVCDNVVKYGRARHAADDILYSACALHVG
jgi:hypothetical protein